MSIQAFKTYHRVIDFLRLRSRAYKFTFKDPKNNEVLKDLAKFCRANTTCFHPDPRIHAALEGRREVFQRILDHLKLEPDELYQIYHRPSTIQPPTPKEE